MVDNTERLTPPEVARYWLLGSLALVVAPHLLRLPLWLGGACLAVIVWRGGKELKGWPLPSRTLRATLTVLGIAGVVVAYHSVIGKEPGIALLTVMLCLKLLELRTLRDATIVVFLGYFMAAGAFLFDQEMVMGAYMFAVALAFTATLAALNHPAGSVGCWREYLRTAGAMLVQGLPVMLLLFVLFPRISGPLWKMPEEEHTARTGLSDDMTLGNISKLAESAEVAFRVEFEGPVPPAGALYWRGPVLWQTNGRRWTQLPSYYQGRKELAYEEQHDPVAYTVTLEPHGSKWLFALDMPGDLPAGARPTRSYALVDQKPVTERRRYRITSYLDYRTGPLTPLERQMALQLPAEANPKTRALGESLREKGLSDQTIVERALGYFVAGGFVYTREPPLLQGSDPVDQFLFEQQRGFCEHYAAAFTTLVRAAGVPARVVTGYQGAEVNALGGFLVVRQSRAHAWSEVWLEGRGWVRVDPTAVLPPERIEEAGDLTRFQSTEPATLTAIDTSWLGATWFRLREGWDALNHTWNSWVLGFDQDKQRQLLRRIGLGDLDLFGVVGVMAGVVAGALAVVMLYLLRQRPRSADPAARLYRRYCDKLARRGLIRAPGEGPVDFAGRVIRERPELREAVAGITDTYVQLRYGAAAGAGEGLRRLERQVAMFNP